MEEKWEVVSVICLLIAVLAIFAPAVLCIILETIVALAPYITAIVVILIITNIASKFIKK